MGAFLQDLQYGLRTLAKRPAFTLVAVLTLALGIGANSTVYTFLNAVLFEPIPFEDDGRTVFAYSSNRQMHTDRGLVSIPNFADWRARSRSFEELAAQGSETLTLTGDGTPERVQATFVTASFFPFLNYAPQLGRAFLPSEEADANSHSAVLSYGFWQRRFGGDPNILGRSITLNSQAYAIVGVMQRKVWFPSPDTALWLPLAVDSQKPRSAHFLMVFGKLKPDVTLQQARADMDLLSKQLEETYPEANAGWTANVLTFGQAVLKDTDRAVMRLLIITVMFVLLIACANISNLLLSRAVGRQKEIAVRTALGATRARLVRQLLTESVVLSLAGGLVGLALAFWGADALIGMIPHRAPPPDTLVNGFIFGVTMLLSLLSAALFGLAPAFEVSRTDVNSTLKEGGRSGSGSIRGRRFRNVLVIAEVTLTVILLIGGGLVIRSSINIRNIEPGFQKNGLLSLDVDVPPDQYKTPEEITSFYSRALSALTSEPGIQFAAATTRVPVVSDGQSTRFVVRGAEGAPVQERPLGAHIEVSADFFRTLDLPIVKGRAFTSNDIAGAASVTVINETMMQRFFVNVDPIGQSIALSEDTGVTNWMTIVGVARDSMPANLAQGRLPQIYIPSAQRPRTAMSFVLRTQGDPLALAGLARKAIWSIDSNLPIDKVATVDQLIEEDFRGGVALSYVFAVFGAVALTLATIGIYGVISYIAAQRTQEIGIRLALGATRGDVMRIIVGQGMKLVIIGAALGLIGGFVLTRLLSGALVGVSANDPLTFFTATFVLMSVAFFATYLPARRAMRIDPIAALRHE